LPKYLRALEAVVTPLYSLVLHFRSSVDREEYGPDNFALLAKELRSCGRKLPVRCTLLWDPNRSLTCS
jgi:hypothetical protein